MPHCRLCLSGGTRFLFSPRRQLILATGSMSADEVPEPDLRMQAPPPAADVCTQRVELLRMILNLSSTTDQDKYVQNWHGLDMHTFMQILAYRTHGEPKSHRNKGARLRKKMKMYGTTWLPQNIVFLRLSKTFFYIKTSISLQEMTPEMVRNMCFVGPNFQRKSYGSVFLPGTTHFRMKPAVDL